jgi:hypothetical protein
VAGTIANAPATRAANSLFIGNLLELNGHLRAPVQF